MNEWLPFDFVDNFTKYEAFGNLMPVMVQIVSEKAVNRRNTS
ncbi:MAG: hypothetical protein ACI92Z_000124 [Paracoccaceae bacterium]|jgi:hypothetical protein